MPKLFSSTALKSSAPEPLTRLLDSSRQPYAICSANGCILHANQAFCLLLGYTGDELHRLRQLSDFTPPECQAAFGQLALDCAAGKSARLEQELLLKDGSRILAEIYGHGILATDGRHICSYLFIHDITGQKRLGRELCAASGMHSPPCKRFHRHSEILDNIADFFFTVNFTWEIGYINSSLRRFLEKRGTAPAALPGNTLWNFAPQSPAFRSGCLKAMEKREHVHLQVFSPFLQCWLDLDLYPAKDGLSVFCRDISERKRFEKEFRRLERLNLIGQMAAGISHEVRNPLTTVRGFLQLLAEKPIGRKHEDYFKIMISELDRANNILTEFLSVAKTHGHTDQYPRQNLNTIIERLKPLLEANSHKNGNNLAISLAAIPEVPLNENEVRQLILNLSYNGLEAMPKGGLLTIRTKAEKNFVVLTIQDQGKGIDNTILSQLGTPFLTTKESGTGLGLPVCYSIAERHGAKLSVKTADTGTAFHIAFPLSTQHG